MSAAHKIQRLGRDFIACNRERVRSLGLIFDKMEMRYVKFMLAKRRQKEAMIEMMGKGGKQAASDEGKQKKGNKGFGSRNKGINTREDDDDDGVDDNEIILDNKTKIEMEKQAKRWGLIDKSIEGYLDRHRKEGLITKETKLEAATKLLLPAPIRHAQLLRFVTLKRKEFCLMREDQRVHQERQRGLNMFTATNAADLLHGRNDEINKAIRDKFDKHLLRLKYAPFVFYTQVSKESILEAVKAAHDLQATFVVKVRTAKAMTRKKTMLGPSTIKTKTEENKI